jgi:hypothetical protein
MAEFKWTPKVSGESYDRIYIHFEFENYQPRLIGN